MERLLDLAKLMSVKYIKYLKKVQKKTKKQDQKLVNYSYKVWKWLNLFLGRTERLKYCDMIKEKL